MSYGKKDIVKVLMERDGMDEQEAQDLVNDCQSDIDDLIYGGVEGMPGIDDAEQIIQDYFGLEPDYLMDFLP